MKECSFCQKGEFLEDEFEQYSLVHLELIPMPALNLTTGEYDKTSEPPYHAMSLRFLDFEFDSEMARFPIKYCPMCGRRLSEIKVNVLLNAEEMATELRRRKSK